MKKVLLLPIALAAAGILFVALRPRPRVMLSLPIGGGEFSTVGGVIREGTWLWPGETLRWTIPPGPSARARLRYHLPIDWPAAGPATLVVRVRSGAAPSETAEEKSSLASGVAEPRWTESTVRVPGSASARSLEVSLEGAGPARPLFLASSTLEWPRPAKTPARRLLVLFDVDTLRADHLPLYGYARPTTPEIDRVFGSGLVAERCFANASWTLPSHVSIFTSTTVNRNGVRSTDGLVPPNFPVLAESLAAGGFSTLAVTGGGFVDAVYGFARGFDRYVSSGDPIETQVGKALAMIDESASPSIFLFFHTYEVHDYAPSEASARELFGSTAPLGDDWRKPLTEPLKRAGGKERTIARYDAALRRVDDAFAALERGLRKRGLWRETSIVLMSDHGEALFEHPGPPGSPPLWGHPLPSLYDGELRVPFLVRAPGRRWSGRIARGTSLLDVAPTILDLAGIPPPPTFEGISAGAAAQTPERVLFAESPSYDAVAVRQGDRKVIGRPGFRQRTWGGGFLHPEMPREECFSTDADPGERRGSDCRAPWAAALFGERDRYVADSFPDSVVLRLSRDTPAPCRVSADAPASAPQIRAFGARPTDRVENAAAESRAEVDLGPGPVWLAVRPTASDRAVAVELDGCGSLRTASGAEASGGVTSGWAGLLWRGAAPLPAGNVVVTVPPMLEPVSGARARQTPELLARLRSLGYLVGDSPREPATPRVPAAPGKTTLAIPPGEIRIRVR